MTRIIVCGNDRLRTKPFVLRDGEKPLAVVDEYVKENTMELLDPLKLEETYFIVKWMAGTIPAFVRST